MGSYIFLNCNTLNATNSHLIDTSSFSFFMENWADSQSVSIGTGWETGRATSCRRPSINAAMASASHHQKLQLSTSWPRKAKSICARDKELPADNRLTCGYLCYPRRFWWRMEGAPLLTQHQHGRMLGLILPRCFRGGSPKPTVSPGLSKGFPARWQHLLNLQHKLEMPQVSALFCFPLMK